MILDVHNFSYKILEVICVLESNFFFEKQLQNMYHILPKEGYSVSVIICNHLYQYFCSKTHQCSH